MLRQKLDSLEKCNLVMTQNYEGQLQTLKAQVRESVHGTLHVSIHVLTYKIVFVFKIVLHTSECS